MNDDRSVPEGMPRRAGENVSVAQGSILIFAASVVSAAGFFVASVVLARDLGPAGRGSVAFMTVAALLMSRVVKVGLGQATSVLAAERPASRGMLLSNLLGFSLVCGLAGGLLVVGCLLLLGVHPAGAGDAALVLLAAAILAASLVDDGFLIGCGRLRAAAAISASGGWLYALLVVAMASTAGVRVETALAAWITAHLLWAALLVSAGARTAGMRPPSVGLLVESIRFGLRAWAGSISQFLNARLDQILVGAIASSATLGLYAVAVNAAEVLLFLPNAVATALLPTLLRAGPDAEGVKRTLRTFRSSLLLTLATIVVAGTAGWILIPIVFGEAFRGSVQPFLLLLPGAIGYVALSIFANSLLAARAPGLASTSRVTSLGAGLALDLVLIPVLGASGAAAAASAAFLAGGMTAISLYRRRAGFRWRELLPARDDVLFLRLVAARAVPRLRGAT
jgi:O-antigen/teichoic acid export membrane protein